MPFNFHALYKISNSKGYTIQKESSNILSDKFDEDTSIYESVIAQQRGHKKQTHQMVMPVVSTYS